MTKTNQNRFWFLFVMSILLFGIGMIVWTVKQAMSVPVHESNNYMLKYQMADMNINEIMTLKAKFDAKYLIEIKDTKFLELNEDLQNTNSKRIQAKPIVVKNGKNSFSYKVTNKDGSIVKNAHVDFLLTRPHSKKEDKLENNVSFSNNLYITKPVTLTKKGRYTLVLKVEIKDTIGYSETSAYLTD